MAAKLEFYRFVLNNKDGDFKTFRDFAIEELKGRKTATHSDVVELIFKHFIKSLNADFASDSKLKKELTLIEKKSVNKYLEFKPVFSGSDYTISGVINGGPYGRDKIISDKADRDNSTALNRKNSVLQYFYFLLYVPPDHNEGCFIIHSNSSDESITILFRNFIGKVFKGQVYNKAIAEAFCPKSFQEEYKSGAVLKSLTFKSSFIDTMHSTDGTQEGLNAYSIKIEAIPKNKNINASEAAKFRARIAKKLFGSKNKEVKLDDFEENKLTIENQVTKTQKVFEWNSQDHDFVPVVYLTGRLKKENEDGTPDFKELRELCVNFFNDEVLPEIRPDLNASKIK